MKKGKKKQVKKW